MFDNTGGTKHLRAGFFQPGWPDATGRKFSGFFIYKNGLYFFVFRYFTWILGKIRNPWGYDAAIFLQLFLWTKNRITILRHDSFLTLLIFGLVYSSFSFPRRRVAHGSETSKLFIHANASSMLLIDVLTFSWAYGSFIINCLLNRPF